jgi:hypothetical integral membrane protein (TIGR02206 family)
MIVMFAAVFIPPSPPFSVSSVFPSVNSVDGLLFLAHGGNNWLTTFHPYTTYHAVCVAGCIAVMTGVALLGLHSRGTPRAQRMRLGVAWVGLVYWVASNIWWNRPGNFQLDKSLPIQICDLAGLIGPLALLTGRRWLRALLYFWGFVLSIQGFIQPVLTVGAAHTEFWLFWANHTGIVGTALYDTVALGFRPRFRDYLISCTALLLFVAIVLPFDIIYHIDYGYIGEDHPTTPPFLRRLGAWPWRLIPFALIVYAATALIWLPWTLVKRRPSLPACPKCGYDLAGLSAEPSRALTCPECGHALPPRG